MHTIISPLERRDRILGYDNGTGKKFIALATVKDDPDAIRYIDEIITRVNSHEALVVANSLWVKTCGRERPGLTDTSNKALVLAGEKEIVC